MAALHRFYCNSQKPLSLAGWCEPYLVAFSGDNLSLDNRPNGIAYVYVPNVIDILLDLSLSEKEAFGELYENKSTSSGIVLLL